MLRVNRPNHHIRLTHQFKLDLFVWQEFLENINGKSFFVYVIFLTGDYCNYSPMPWGGGIGYGAVCMAMSPNVFLLLLNITVLELYPIMTETVEIACFSL